MGLESKKKILIAEDDPDMFNLYKGLFKDRFNLMLAVNGREAVGLAASELPDLIIMDIMMPEMDGWEALTRIKNNPATAAIPVILLSALSEYSDIRKGYNLGADGYITKPFSSKELMTRLNLCLQNAPDPARSFPPAG